MIKIEPGMYIATKDVPEGYEYYTYELFLSAVHRGIGGRANFQLDRDYEYFGISIFEDGNCTVNGNTMSFGYRDCPDQQIRWEDIAPQDWFDEKWENGELGRDEEFVRVCDPEEQARIETVLQSIKDSLEDRFDKGSIRIFDPEQPHQIRQKIPELPPKDCLDSYDMVKKPKHYELFPEHGIEVKDVRKALMGKIDSDTPFIQVSHWDRALEYLLRMWHKNGLEDAKKARVYLDWLIDELEG